MMQAPALRGKRARGRGLVLGFPLANERHDFHLDRIGYVAQCMRELRYDLGRGNPPLVDTNGEPVPVVSAANNQNDRFGFDQFKHGLQRSVVFPAPFGHIHDSTICGSSLG